MKHKILSLALVLVIILSVVPAASAETLTNLGNVTAGTEIDILIPNANGDAVSLVKDNYLPSGCKLETEEKDNTPHHYLRGTPLVAGSYTFDISVTSGGSETAVLRCSLTVDPATPSISASGGVSCYLGDSATVSVTASVYDSGTLSYQWYASSSSSNVDGLAISGAMSSAYTVPTSNVGTTYYYCVVTNNNVGYLATAVSSPIQVKVTETVVSSIAIETAPVKTEYIKGETLDKTGLSIKVYMGNGTTAVLTEGFGVHPTQLDSVGTQEVTVSYGGCSTSFKVTVTGEEEAVESIKVQSEPSKLTYAIGDDLSTTGLVIRLYFNNNTYKDVTTGFSCEPTLLTNMGTQTITVNYGSKECTFTVNVEDKNQIKSIAIESMPEKLDYVVGDKLNTTGLKLSVTYNDRTQSVASGFSCTPTTLTSEGTQTVTVSFGGKDCTYTVNVGPAPAPTPTPVPTETPAPTEEPEPTEEPAPTLSPEKEAKLDRANTVIVIVLVLAIIALIGLGGYFYLVTVAKREVKLSEIGEMLRKLFKK